MALSWMSALDCIMQGGDVIGSERGLLLARVVLRAGFYNRLA
jgi:hypothetical protein